MNKVLLVGRLSRDPEMRSLASGRNVTTFTVVTAGGPSDAEESEFHSVIAWDALADVAGRYLGKGQVVAIEGSIRTRAWDDETGRRHWKTEILAEKVDIVNTKSSGNSYPTPVTVSEEVV